MAIPDFLNSKLLILSAFVTIIALLFFFTLGASQDKIVYRNISFEYEGANLSGVIVSPANTTLPMPCVVFVHGSGDVPRDSFGYYQTYWKKFAQQGWCSLSWDKPGVGASEGNWQEQSMDERASEVAAAVAFLRSQPETGQAPVGLIGFSQAGWVMPKVTQLRNDIAFIISISGAVDWMEQARFSGETRMKDEGYSDTQIAIVQQFGNKVDDAIKSGAPYQTYLDLMAVAPEGEDTTMSEQYWPFVLRNWRANVRHDLASINVPVLAIYGSHDAYVDPVGTAQDYRKELERSAAPFFDVITFQNADHGLMLTDTIAPSYRGWRAWLSLFKIWFGDESVFPPDYFATLQNWLENFTDRTITDD